MAESPERIGRFRRIVSLVAVAVAVAVDDVDVAKDRLTGTKAVANRMLERVAKNAMIAVALVVRWTMVVQTREESS
jgi:hypothetical protein